MMASNIVNAEAGGYPEPSSDNWWLPKWSSWLASIGAVVLAVISVFGIIFNILSPFNMIASGLQLLAAAVILSIEGSYVVSFLTFAKPIGMYFEGKPTVVKLLVYVGLTVVPILIGSSVSNFLGFIISAGITSLYGMILIGKKGNMDDMKAVASEQPKI